jgi:hypothetical protein
MQNTCQGDRKIVGIKSGITLAPTEALTAFPIKHCPQTG